MNISYITTDMHGDPDIFKMYWRFWAEEVIFLEGVNNAASIAFAMHDPRTNTTEEDIETMTLLIPDRDRENQEDFIWCLPVPREKWNKWHSLSEKFKTITPENFGSVRYMNRMEGREVRTIVMLAEQHHDDDSLVTACAYLRMVKNLTCRIYVIRSTDQVLSAAKMMHKVVGIDPKTIEDMEGVGDEGEAAQVPVDQ